MEKDALIIVIGRQFGGGGRALGRELSRRMRIPVYDKEMLSEAAERFGIDRRLFERSDEKKPSILRSLLESACGNAMPTCDDQAIGPDRLYQIQSQVISHLAGEGSAIFVGRTADYVLRAHPGLLSIFVHADVEQRARRIVERGDASTLQDAAALARRQDKVREGYYNYFTGRKWGDAANYDLSINLGRISIAEAADMVEKFVAALRAYKAKDNEA